MVAAVATETYGQGYFNPGPRPMSPVMTSIQDTGRESLHSFILYDKECLRIQHTYIDYIVNILIHTAIHPYTVLHTLY